MRHQLPGSVNRTRSYRIAYALVLFFLLGPVASSRAADEPGRLNLLGHHYSVIAGASMYVPDEAATRSIYGRRSFSPVLTLWSFATPRGVGLSWDLGAQRLSEAGRTTQVLHGGVGPRVLFAPAHADFAPYLTVRGSAYALHLDQGWHTKPGANVELGASVLRHVVVSARYDAVPKVNGVSLSGFSGRVAVKVF